MRNGEMGATTSAEEKEEGISEHNNRIKCAPSQSIIRRDPTTNMK